jgi:protein tyrosine phosphatase (PTP) superfamily phosphohydrolase (DUF442 family)
MKGSPGTLYTLCTLCACILSGAYAHAAESPKGGSAANVGMPANFLIVTDRIHTSAQPTRAQFVELKANGYALVINLATPASAGAIADEGSLIAKQGISYVNVPVDFRAPSLQDFDLFSTILRQTGSRRVLVHCQVNKRASAFTFLHRVVHDGIAPDEAWKNVVTIWEPDPQWIDLIRVVLKRHGINFDPF